MAVKSLAVKYRPMTFDDVVEQGSIKTILRQQLDTDETKNAYLFCGGAGTGKTTCARIFANEINHHQGNPIEMDAASNSGVEDVREIITQAKSKSLDSEYKVFIIDECHSLSNTAWQALLKLIEEPPAKSIFIFCTTDPQKIPRTILSRVQRYDFQRISQSGVVRRLTQILDWEDIGGYETDAVSYVAKLADGGMRDAITLLDKCLAYDDKLTVENVVAALGTVNYDVMYDLTCDLVQGDGKDIVRIIEEVHYSGKDLKQFCKQFMEYLLDVNKYQLLRSMELLSVPSTQQRQFDELVELKGNYSKLLATVIKLNAEIKWETAPKAMIEATLLLEANE